MLIHGDNQIHIGFLTPQIELNELFKYNGDFQIISAKVNEKNVAVEVFGIDYWNSINSDWDYAGKPEIYKGTYKYGRSPKKQASKGLNNKKVTKLSSGGY